MREFDIGDRSLCFLHLQFVDILKVTMPVKPEMLELIAMPMIKQKLTEKPDCIASDENLQKFQAICDYARLFCCMMGSDSDYGTIASIETEPIDGHIENCTEMEVNHLPIKTEINEQLIETSDALKCLPNNSLPKSQRINKPFKCDECYKSFRCKSILISHKTSHTNEKPFACDMCEKSFRLKHQLKQHKFCHSEIPTIACDWCDMIFKFSFKLHKHIREHHPNKLSYECSMCKKRFFTPNGLRTHKNKSRMCGLQSDGMIFVKSNIVDGKNEQFSIESNHSHEKSKPSLFRCNLCEKHFITNWRLKRHIVSHNIVRPHKCDFCEKRYKLKHDLTKHIRDIHSNEIPESIHINDSNGVKDESNQAILMESNNVEEE